MSAMDVCGRCGKPHKEYWLPVNICDQCKTKCERCGAENPSFKDGRYTLCTDCARAYFVGPGGERDLARERRAFWERRYERWSKVLNEDEENTTIEKDITDAAINADLELAEWDKRFNPTNPTEASK